jgi:hypothetical protein
LRKISILNFSTLYLKLFWTVGWQKKKSDVVLMRAVR